MFAVGTLRAHATTETHFEEVYERSGFGTPQLARVLVVFSRLSLPDLARISEREWTLYTKSSRRVPSHSHTGSAHRSGTVPPARKRLAFQGKTRVHTFHSDTSFSGGGVGVIWDHLGAEK